MGLKGGAAVAKNVVIRPLNYAVFQPIGKLGATEAVGKGARGIGEFLNNTTTKLRKAAGLPEPKLMEILYGTRRPMQLYKRKTFKKN